MTEASALAVRITIESSLVSERYRVSNDMLAAPVRSGAGIGQWIITGVDRRAREAIK